MRQRPFFMAGPRQAERRLVFALHRAAFVKSPGGFPLFSHPRRGAWGSSPIFATPPPFTRAPSERPGDDGLATLLDVDELLVLDNDALRPM
jgi:hypothetical protein